MCLTTLVMMAILQSKLILIMLITKTLKLAIVCAEFEIIILLVPGSIYIYLILHLVSPEGPPWLELREQNKFLCVF